MVWLANGCPPSWRRSPMKGPTRLVCDKKQASLEPFRRQAATVCSSCLVTIRKTFQRSSESAATSNSQPASQVRSGIYISALNIPQTKQQANKHNNGGMRDDRSLNVLMAPTCCCGSSRLLCRVVSIIFSSSLLSSSIVGQASNKPTRDNMQIQARTYTHTQKEIHSHLVGFALRIN